MLERAQAPGLIHLEARVLGFPAVEGLLADSVTPAEVDALRPGLGLEPVLATFKTRGAFRGV
jgi:hypothetical protein